MQAFNFLSHEILKSYTISDTADGFCIEHTTKSGNKHMLITRSSYLIDGLEFLETILKHQMKCDK